MPGTMVPGILIKSKEKFTLQMFAIQIPTVYLEKTNDLYMKGFPRVKKYTLAFKPW